MRGARQVYEEQATHTRVRLTFYSFDRDGFSGSVDGFDPAFGYIVGAQTSKQFGGAAGAFSITVKKPLEVHRASSAAVRGTGVAESWTRLWSDPEGAGVLIQWGCDGEVIDGTLGIIDTVSENTSRQAQGERAEVYTISGRDFGKIFEQTQAFVNIYDQAAVVGIAGIFQRLSGNITGPPGGFVEALINAWVGNYEGTTQPWRLPPGLGSGAFYDILRRRIGCKDEEIDGFYADASLVAPDQDGKNLWSLLQEYANGLLNELWLDMGPAQGQPKNALSGLVPTIYLRRKPFKVLGDTQRWDRLLTHELELSDVNARQVAKGGPAHRFNYWIMDLAGRQGIELQGVLQQHGAQTGRPGSIPIWNIASIEKYGLRKWQQGTPFLPISSRERGTQFAQLAGNWLRRLHDWYAPAPLELSGTIATTRLRPEIRIGHRVREHRHDGVITYYVEGVVNAYTYGQAGQTTLTLTRGEYADEDHLRAVYAELDRQPAPAVAVPAEPAAPPDELMSELANLQIAYVQELGAEAEIVDGGLPGEGVTEADPDTTTPDESDQPSPSEVDAGRAFRGEQHVVQLEPVVFEHVVQLEPVVFESDESTLDQEALESGEPIGISGLDFDDASMDPLEGLP